LPTAQNTVEYQPLMREKKGKNRVSAMWTRLAHQAPAIIHTLFPPTGWKNFDTAEPWGRFGNRSPLKQGTLRISLPNDARFVLSRSLFRSLLRDAGLQDLRLRRRRVISLLSGTEQHMKTRPTLKTLVFCIVLSIAPIAGRQDNTARSLSRARHSSRSTLAAVTESPGGRYDRRESNCRPLGQG
jgi:hypothetical protein